MPTIFSNIPKLIRLLVLLGPRYASLFVTRRCNRRCRECVVPQSFSDDLPTQIWLEIIDRIAKFDVHLITFLGGETLLRDDLEELVGYASKRKGIAVSLTTNGDMLYGLNGKDRILRLASRGLTIMALSLHDYDDLGRQLDLLQFAKTVGIIPMLSAVATKQSVDYLPEVMMAANGCGISFRLTWCQTIGGAFSSSDSALRPDKNQIVKIVEIVQKQKEQTLLVSNTDEFFQAATLYPDQWHCDPNRDNLVVVSPEGNLMACCEWPTNISVLKIKSLRDWRWKKAREAIRNSCRGCTQQCQIEAEQTRNFAFAREALSRVLRYRQFTNKQSTRARI